VDILKPKGAFSVDEFCAWASIGRSKFYGEVNEGRIRLRKVGRKSIVTDSDARAWLEALPTLEPSSAKTADCVDDKGRSPQNNPRKVPRL